MMIKSSLFEESKSLHHNNAVLIKDCTFIELFLFEPKSGTLLLDKKLEKEKKRFSNFNIHISEIV